MFIKQHLKNGRKISPHTSAWATLLAYGSMVITSYFFGRKYYAVPYEISKIIYYILISVVLSAVSFIYFREQLFISILMMILFGGFIYWNEKKQLKLLFKKINKK